MPVIAARFTYVYNKRGDEWKIMVHHSSQQPVYQSDDGLVKQHLQSWFKALFTQSECV